MSNATDPLADLERLCREALPIRWEAGCMDIEECADYAAAANPDTVLHLIQRVRVLKEVLRPFAEDEQSWRENTRWGKAARVLAEPDLPQPKEK